MNTFFPKMAPNTADLPVCTEIMDRVDELSPSDSNVNAFINLLADGTYHTVIAIEAACGRFRSEAKTFSFVTSLKQAQSSMLAILADWKKERFANESA